MKKIALLVTVFLVTGMNEGKAQVPPTTELRPTPPLAERRLVNPAQKMPTAPTVEPYQRNAKPGFLDRHPRIYSCTFPLRHPVLAFRKATFPINHPLQFGKACESSGANGLLGFMAGCANVATPTILGLGRR